MRLPPALMLYLSLVGCGPQALSNEHEAEPTLQSTLEDIGLFIDGSDENGDGKLSLDEFRTSIASQTTNVVGPALLNDTFSRYDQNGDGFISADELDRLARKAWVNAPPQE